MSSKAGYLKTEKNFGNQIGDILQQVGQKGYEIMDTGIIQTGAGTIGQALGSALIPIPIVGGQIGKAVGKAAVDGLKYRFGTIGEIGKSIQDVQNGSNVGKEILDVLSYIPRQKINDFMNGDMMKVITGEMNWRDAALNKVEDYLGLNWMTDKTHAWKDQQGNYHKEYVPGSTMVVGKWIEPSEPPLPTPDLSSNAGILGVHNGEIFYKGFDDARWAQIQSKK